MPTPSYLRTQQGNQELENRALKLTPRQRALLRMVEADLSKSLNRQQFEQLASVENLQVLLDYQLIVAQQEQLIPHLTEIVASAKLVAAAEPAVPVLTANVLHAEPVSEIVANRVVEVPEQTIIAAPEPVVTAVAAPESKLQSVNNEQTIEPVEVELLDFDGVKQLMSFTLKEYCGLLASQLIRDIQQATSPARLRMCQIHWITTLTESRAESKRVAAWHQQVSMSLSC